MITVVDLGTGNLQSVKQALERVGTEVAITSDPAEVARARILVLPGVGAFGDGARAIERLELREGIRGHAAAGRPLLAICLGMQLLADESEEYGRHAGLGIIRGGVVRLHPTGPGTRVPNMGWCDVSRKGQASLLPEEGPPESFYFAHSYHFQCAGPGDVAATIAYGEREVVAAIERGKVFGVQFHPEKSQHAGLDLLARFCRRAGAT